MKKLFVTLMIVISMLLFAVPALATDPIEELATELAELAEIVMRPTSARGIIENEVLPSTVAIVAPMALGAGVIGGPDGYIITARHVVEGCEYVDVYLNDFTRYRGRVVGYHSECDIAVVKIMPLKELMPLNHPEFNPPQDGWNDIANPHQTFVGETVYAIGHPVGLVWSITKGILVQRRTFNDKGIRYYQIDAAINPGNSGGPLVNENAQVIGIIVQAIPAFMAENVALAISVLSFAEEVCMLVEEDRKRLDLIADVRAYIEGEEPEEKPQPKQIIITLPDDTKTDEK